MVTFLYISFKRCRAVVRKKILTCSFPVLFFPASAHDLCFYYSFFFLRRALLATYTKMRHRPPSYCFVHIVKKKKKYFVPHNAS